MTNKTYRIWIALLFIMTMAACATTGEPEQTGFLSDYSNLERSGDDQWRYLSDKFVGYSKFYIEPVAILFERTEDPEFSNEELEQLKTYMRTSIIESLTEDDGYEVVSEAGPGVATFRLGISDIDASIAALNITIYTKATGAGLGGIAAEGEVVDSMTGEQLAAAIRWGSGSRVLQAGLSKFGDAKIVINRWAKDMRQRLDAAQDSAK